MPIPPTPPPFPGARRRTPPAPFLGALAGLSLALFGFAFATPLLADEEARPPTLDPTYGLHTPKPGRAAKPEPDAQWIWADHTRDVQTVYLRGTVTLEHIGRHAVLYVTADNFFTAWVNGKQVDESKPDPKDDLVWSHTHRKDITDLLVIGKNVIALRAVNAGGAAAALARLEVDGKPRLLSGVGWRVSEQAPADWNAAAFDDSGWKPATVLAQLGEGPWGGQLSGWPGSGPEVPYLAHLPVRPVAVHSLHPGAGAIEGAESLTDGLESRLTVRLAPAGSADPPGLVLDFGEELAGRIELASTGPGTVLVGTGESEEEAIKSPWGGVHRLELYGDGKGYTPYSAFRYARLTFLPGEKPAKQLVLTSVLLDHKYYPVDYRGSFDCSDSLLTRIWYTGAYTAHLCMQEDIWDAPKRDRARWMGDLHVSGEVINLAFADRFLMEQTMQRLREEAQGGQPVGAAPKSHVNGIPGYSCAWIAGLADFHRHLGDYEYLRKQHDLLIGMLEFLRGELDDQGLFANRRKQWPFVDWSPDFNGDGPLSRQATHFFLVKAAREGAFLLKEMGDDAASVRYSAWADMLTTAAQQHYARPGGVFSDRRQDNAMAIYAGVARPEQARAIWDAVLRPGSPAWEQVATPYYNNYVIYAMAMSGHARETLAFLRSYWGGMLEQGATSWWEGYDPRWSKRDYHAHLQADNGTGYFVSLCHGWSAGPTSWLTERVLGVNPTSGGFKTVRIAPDLGDLEWAKGSVPTPNGSLKIRVSRKAAQVRIELTLPRGIDATIPVPGAAAVNGQLVTPQKGDVHLSSAGSYQISYRP